MRYLALAVALLTPGLAMADAPAPAAPAGPEMVLIPAGVAQTAINWIQHPDATNAVTLYAVLTACVNDNPHNGAVMRMGQDLCSEVTAAIAARDKEVADLKKQVEDTKAAAEKAAKDAKDTAEKAASNAKDALDVAIAAQKDADQKIMIQQVAEANRIAQAKIDALEHKEH